MNQHKIQQHQSEPAISLAPLTKELHVGALQHLYRATPGYWQMYELEGVPPGQAARDFDEAADTPQRTMMGIVERVDPRDTRDGGQLIGLIDFRLYWPEEEIAYLGMIMVREAHQRRGIGSQAWHLLHPWLAEATNATRVRLGVEQFNVAGLKFFQQLGFQLTSESNRIKTGEKLVRLLYMEQEL